MSTEEIIRKEAIEYSKIWVLSQRCAQESYLAGRTASLERIRELEAKIKQNEIDILEGQGIVEGLDKEAILLRRSNKELQDVLRELVELKDMKEEMEAGLPHDAYWELNAQYLKRKPLAWEAARKALSQPITTNKTI